VLGRFGVLGCGFCVQGSGFPYSPFRLRRASRVQGCGFWVLGLSLRLRLRPHTLGSRFGVHGSAEPQAVERLVKSKEKLHRSIVLF
jgi:hypothetical protein